MKHNQTLTYWSTTGSFDLYGKPVWSAPKTLKVRWEGNTRIAIKTGTREEFSEAVIYTENDVLKKGDYVLEGISTALSPVQEAREIKQRIVTPNLRGTKVEYRLVL